MAVKTILEQVEEVQSCITKLMNGEEVSMGGKRLRYSDLDSLTRREQMLLTQYNRSQGRGLTTVTGIMKRD